MLMSILDNTLHAAQPSDTSTHTHAPTLSAKGRRAALGFSVVEAAIELLPTDAALVAFFDTGGSDAGLTRGGGGGGGGGFVGGIF